MVFIVVKLLSWESNPHHFSLGTLNFVNWATCPVNIFHKKVLYPLIQISKIQCLNKVMHWGQWNIAKTTVNNLRFLSLCICSIYLLSSYRLILVTFKWLRTYIKFYLKRLPCARHCDLSALHTLSCLVHSNPWDV